MLKCSDSNLCWPCKVNSQFQLTTLVRANLPLSFDREGVSYLNFLSNDENRHSNLNSKVRFNTGYVLIYIQEKCKLEQLEIQTQRDNCFLDPKKKMLSQSFVQNRILLHFIAKGFRNLKFCWLQITALFINFFFSN